MDRTFDYGLLNTQTDPRFADRKYGRLGTVAKNGCGMIALYNVERKTNLFGLLGTRPSSVREILEPKGFKVTELDKKHPEGDIRHDAVIVLYWYWFGAHYVSGFLNREGTYTLYNYFTRPYAMSLDRFLETLKTSKNHVVRVWGVDFPKEKGER